MWVTRELPLPEVLQAASRLPYNASWSAACSEQERALHLTWASLSDDLVDVVTDRSRLAALDGTSLLLLGDSLMLQPAAAAAWVWPDFSERPPPEAALAALKGGCLASRTGSFGGGGRNFTLHACRVNQAGPGFEAVLAALFTTSLFDVVVFNVGLWYQFGEFEGGAQAVERARASARSSAPVWTPLGRAEYEADLHLLRDQLGAHAAAAQQGAVPRVVFLETTPTHFTGGTFGPASKSQAACVHFSAADYATSHWRNVLSEALVSAPRPAGGGAGGGADGDARPSWPGLPTVRHASHLAPLHWSHVHRDGGVAVDCAHWCNPGLVPLHTLRLIVNKALELLLEGPQGWDR